MKKKLAIIAPVLLMGASSVMANDSGLTPYIGLDAQVRHMSFKNGFGGNLFNHTYPQGNVYVGLKFNNCIGIEVGFAGGPKRSKNAVLNAGDVDLGAPIVGNFARLAPLVYNTTTKISNFHVNLIGFYPLTSELDLYGTVGYSRMRTHFTRTLAAITPASRSVVRTVSGQPFHFTKNKNALRLGVGLQQMLSCNVGIRGGLTWEKTSKLDNLASPSSQNSKLKNTQAIVKLKDGFTYSLGVYWQF